MSKIIEAVILGRNDDEPGWSNGLPAALTCNRRRLTGTPLVAPRAAGWRYSTVTLLARLRG